MIAARVAGKANLLRTSTRSIKKRSGKGKSAANLNAINKKAFLPWDTGGNAFAFVLSAKQNAGKACAVKGIYLDFYAKNPRKGIRIKAPFGGALPNRLYPAVKLCFI